MPEPADRRSVTLHWVNQYLGVPDIPGGTRHYDMARELRRRGHAVRLVGSDLAVSTTTGDSGTGGAGGARPRTVYRRRRSARDLRSVREVIDDVPYTWLPAGSYRGNDWRRPVSMVVFSGFVLLDLLRVRRTEGTVFIGSTPHLFAALATWAAAKVKRVPFVLEVRDLWPESYAEVSGRTDGFQIRLMRVIADLLYRRADAVVVLAEANGDHIAERGVPRDRIHHVPNGVDLEPLPGPSGNGTGTPSPSTPPPSLRRDGCFTFVYAGAHGPANGLDVVVRAARALLDRGRADLRVALVGDGTTKGELRALAESIGATNVDFVDPVPKSAIGGLLASADAGLMILADVDLFRYGVSPNKLFDYLAAGLPVVTNVPGLVAGIVEDAEAGLVAAPGDPAALADTMEALVGELGQQPSAFDGGRAFVAANYDRRALAVRFETVLRGCVT